MTIIGREVGENGGWKVWISGGGFGVELRG